MDVRKSISIFVALVAFVASAAAQTTVSIQPPRDDIYVNEPFEISVVVQNFQDCGEPEFPDLPDCTIEKGAGGESTQTSIINGRARTTRTRTFDFIITATKTGQLLIPPVKVLVDGKRLGTRSVRVDVIPSDAHDRFMVEIMSDVKQAYVGQQLRLTLAIWIEPVMFDGDKITAAGMYSCLQRGELGSFPAPTVDSYSEKQRSASDGKRRSYYVFTSTLDYVAERPGPLQFPDVRVEASYPMKIVRDVFGGLRITSARTLRAGASGPDVEILTLPTEGRDPNFGGAVGRFEINASARPLQVRVGDPIELTIEIRGDGPLDTLPAPLLASDEALARGFRVPRETLTGETSGRVRRFKQTIRPTSTDIREIPSISYPYFDPFDGRYAIAKTKPIPIKITGGESLEVAPLNPESGEPPPTIEETVGYRGNESAEAQLLRVVSPVRIGHVIAAAAAPPVTVSALWALGAFVKTRRAASGARRSRASATARRRLESAAGLPPREAAHEILTALAGFIADRTEKAPAQFMGRAGVEYLRSRSIDAGLLTEFATLVERCEAVGFGGGAGDDMKNAAEAARACVDKLEREARL